MLSMQLYDDMYIIIYADCTLVVPFLNKSVKEFSEHVW